MWRFIDDYYSQFRDYLDSARGSASKAGSSAYDHVRDYADSARSYLPSWRRNDSESSWDAGKHAGEGLLLGVVVGAAAMYLFDPEKGRDRRSRLREKLVGTYQRTTESASHLVEDQYHRAQDAASTLRSKSGDAVAGLKAKSKDVASNLKSRSGEVASNLKSKMGIASGDMAALEQRVRAAIGKSATGGGDGIDVRIEDGMVTLSGSAQPGDVDAIVRAVTDVKGVKGVEKQFHKDVAGGRSLTL